MPSSVNLGPVLEATIDRLVKEGRYGSRSEVLREGVRLVEEREAWHAQLVERVAAGLADIAAGDVFEAEAVFDELEARYATMAKPR